MPLLASHHYVNPYTGTTFFSFLWKFLGRLISLATGQVPFTEVVSDELQIFVLVGVSISAALVGSFLILKRMTMLANALSHTILLGIVGAYLMSGPPSGSHHEALNLPVMLVAAVITGLITAFLTQFLTSTARLQEDASTGLVFTSMFAVGIILVTLLTRNAHIGTEVVMGNVDALHFDDCILVYQILALNLVVFTMFFKEFKLVAFDSPFARALGYSVAFFNYLLMVQVSATCIGAFRAVGVLMVLTLITAPPLTARLFTHDLKRLLLLSAAIGSLASIFGVAWARHLLTLYRLPLSTGGIVVCILSLMYAAALTWWLVRRPAPSPKSIDPTS